MLQKVNPKSQLEMFESKLKALKPKPKKEIFDLSDKLEKFVFTKLRSREILTLIEGKKENIEKLKGRLKEIKANDRYK